LREAPVFTERTSVGLDVLLTGVEDDDQGFVLFDDGFWTVGRHGDGVVVRLTVSRVDGFDGGRQGDGGPRAAWDVA